MLVLSTLYTNVWQRSQPSYTKVLGYFYADEVKEHSLNFGNGNLDIRLKDGSYVNYTVPSISLFLEDTAEYRQRIIEENKTLGADDQIVITYLPAKDTSMLSLWLPAILLMGGMFVFYYFMFRQQGGGKQMMNFGKARYKTAADDKRKVTFADVASVDEEKEELTEVVEFLRHPGQFTALGARVPKGVLLVGPPGTGKTLLARATAGEAGVGFFSVSGSDFVEMYVGMGASRVRDLFEQAKKNLPCIIFIDEIDAVGRKRGAGLGGGHDEREQTLNQILVEMDGFGVNEGVVIVAATNRPDVLDPALLRAGRFDRQIVVNLPDEKGREAVLKVHAKNKPLAPDVSLETIAKTTVGFSPADLENILNEAALLAARKKRKAITHQDIEEATSKVTMGPEKKSRKIIEKDRRITAVHEAGHAVVSYYLPTQDPVHEISIIPRGMAGGYTQYLPKEDRSHVTRNAMTERIIACMGGRVAEKLTLDDITTGASHDIQTATGIARDMVTKYGFSEKLGPVSWDSGEEIFIGRDFGHAKGISDVTAAEIDEEIRRILEQCFERCTQILSEHRAQLDDVADYLLEHEKMNGEQFDAYMKGQPLDPQPEQTSTQL
ncbi:MAG: ATP-dependent zinc metalloprotease FtsH [Clostridia bacterium]|nr:ATP-dependent zinc metalloprotease FtsH [Clostridia bacterium]